MHHDQEIMCTKFHWDQIKNIGSARIFVHFHTFDADFRAQSAYFCSELNETWYTWSLGHGAHKILMTKIISSNFYLAVSVAHRDILKKNHISWTVWDYSNFFSSQARSWFEECVLRFSSKSDRWKTCCEFLKFFRFFKFFRKFANFQKFFCYPKIPHTRAVILF